MVGLSYERSYRHFRAQHSTGFNLTCHALGLAHTLIANFALLHAIDAKLIYLGWSPVWFSFAYATLGVTLIGLVTHTGPFLAKSGAVFNVLWTYYFGIYATIHWRPHRCPDDAPSCAGFAAD